MDACFVGRRRRLLVCRPRQQAFGLAVSDVMAAFHVARHSATPLLILAKPDSPNRALFDLKCEGVVRLNPRSLPALWARVLFALRLPMMRLAWTITRPLNNLVAALQWTNWAVGGAVAIAADVLVTINDRGRIAWNLGVKAVVRRLRNSPLRGWADWTSRLKVPKLTGEGLNLRDRAGAARHARDHTLESLRIPVPAAPEIHHGYDMRELSVKAPLRVSLSRRDEVEAAKLAAELGVPTGRFVLLHVREGSAAAVGDVRSKDEVRNASLESFVPCIDAIVARGIGVVRIGDAGMTPVRRPGVIDLATDPRRTQALELWCLRHCWFFIAADSGPYLLSWLLETPCLSVNITNVLGVFPLRATDRYLIKRLRTTADGRLMPFAEMLREDVLYGIRRRVFKDRDLQYVDNSPEELTAAVLEMVDVLSGVHRPESEAQRAFRTLVATARAGALSKAKTLMKTNAGVAFLGEGRVVDAFVRQDFAT